MGKPNDEQIKWLKKWLGLASSQPPPLLASPQRTPTGGTPGPSSTVGSGNTIEGVIRQPVMMAGPAPGGGNAGNGGSGSDKAKPADAGAGSGGPTGGGDGGQHTPYPGHGPTPPGSYPKDKPAPSDAEKKGRTQAERDLNRNPGNKKSTFDKTALEKDNYKKLGGDESGNVTPLDEDGQPVDRSKLHTDTELKQALDAYGDPKNPMGKSVKDLKIVGKTADELHKELESKGFKLQDPEGRLKDFNPKTKQMEYKLRDGGFTTDLEIAKKQGVPQYIYVNKDGGMVRVKPEGTPGNPQRNEPNISKSVLYKVEFDEHGKAKDVSFENEAFKVGDDGKVTAKMPTVGNKMGPDGNPVPKTPSDAGGMRKDPRGMEAEKPNPHNDPQIEAKNKEIRERNKARKKGYDDVAMEKGHVPAPTNPHPTPAGTPPQSPPSGSPGPQSPPTTGKAGEAHVDVKAAEAFIHNSQENHKLGKEVENKLAKGDTHVDTSHVQKQTATLEAEGEVVAKQLMSHPDLAGVGGSNGKQFFGKVRAKFVGVRLSPGSIVVLALNVANAYELVQQVRYILDSNSVDEALRKSYDVGTDMVKEGIKFGALKFVVRRTPIAVGIQVFLGDLDKNSRYTPLENFNNAIAAAVNKARPGAVHLGHVGTLDQFADDEAKNLYLKARQETVDSLKGNLAKEMTTIGYEDGLTGSKTKMKFEVSDDDKAILQIEAKWLEEMYNKGSGDGNRRKTEAIQRARAEGLEDGKAGKPSNPERLNNWYELKAVIKRIENSTGDVKLDSIAVQNQFYDSYKEGYAAGHKSFGTDPIAKLEITPASFSMSAYASRRLIATGYYADKTTIDLTEKVKWTSDKPKVVDIGERWVDGGTYKGTTARELQGMQAYLLSAGTANITAEYEVHGHKVSAKITITVTAPKISVNAIEPLVATYTGPGKWMAEVGKTQRFAAQVYAGDHWDDLAPGLYEITWDVKPSGLIEVDRAGHATMVKEGKATIWATEVKSSATAKVEVSVEPAGSLVMGRKLNVKR